MGGKKKRELRKSKKNAEKIAADLPAPKKKKITDMTPEEKKAYNKKKQKESRSRMKQKLKTPKRSIEEVKDRVKQSKSTHQSSSRSTRYRAMSRIKETMPSSPTTYAEVVDKLIESATPKKTEALQSRGVKRKLYETEDTDMTNAMTKSIKSIKLLKGPSKSVSIHTFGKICMNRGMSSRKVAKIGLSSRAFSRIKKGKDLRNKRKDAIQPEIVDLAQDFWYEKSRELPLQKRVKKSKPLCLLESTYSTAFKDFKKRHPQIKLGYCKFIQLKPANVRTLGAMERTVCCCTVCENTKLKMKVLQRFVTKESANDDSIDASKLNVPTEHDLSALTLCTFPENGYPARECLERTCQ